MIYLSQFKLGQNISGSVHSPSSWHLLHLRKQSSIFDELSSRQLQFLPIIRFSITGNIFLLFFRGMGRLVWLDVRSAISRAGSRGWGKVEIIVLRWWDESVTHIRRPRDPAVVFPESVCRATHAHYKPLVFALLHAVCPRHWLPAFSVSPCAMPSKFLR